MIESSTAAHDSASEHDERLLARVKAIHHDRSEHELRWALCQAKGLTEDSGNVRLLEVLTLLVLD